MFLLYQVIFLAITTQSHPLCDILPIRAVLLRSDDWRPVRRILPLCRLKAASCEEGHRDVHHFGKTRRTNPPWITKTLRTNPPWFGKNTTNEPTAAAAFPAKMRRTNPTAANARAAKMRRTNPNARAAARAVERDKTKPFRAIRSSELMPCQWDRTTEVFAKRSQPPILGDHVTGPGRRQNAPNEPNGPTILHGRNCAERTHQTIGASAKTGQPNRAPIGGLTGSPGVVSIEATLAEMS
jgi:hypothetical protein